MKENTEEEILGEENTKLEEEVVNKKRKEFVNIVKKRDKINKKIYKF
jgi:hypothetical protein